MQVMYTVQTARSAVLQQFLNRPVSLSMYSVLFCTQLVVNLVAVYYHSVLEAAKTLFTNVARVVHYSVLRE